MFLKNASNIKSSTGADLGFSRGWLIFKKSESDLLLGRPNWFSELSQSSKKILFWPHFVRRRQIFEKKAKKSVFRHFWKISTKSRVFFGARSPLKVKIFWHQKFKGFSAENWYLKLVQRCDRLGRRHEGASPP